MKGYVWSTNPFSDFPSLIWIVLANSPEEAVDKLIKKLKEKGNFTEARLDEMKTSLLAVAPQDLDMSGDVGLLTVTATVVQL